MEMERKGFAVFGILEGLSSGKILLIQDKNKPAPSMWKLPGGKSEKGESSIIALIRELEEELKINILPLNDKDVVFEKNLDSHIFMVYKVNYISKAEVGEEIEKLKLFSVAEIKGMIAHNEILPRHAQALNAYMLSF